MNLDVRLIVTISQISSKVDAHECGGWCGILMDSDSEQRDLSWPAPRGRDDADAIVELLLLLTPVNCHYAAINGAECQLTAAAVLVTPRSIEFSEYFKSISDIPAPPRHRALSVSRAAPQSPTVTTAVFPRSELPVATWRQSTDVRQILSTPTQNK